MSNAGAGVGSVSSLETPESITARLDGAKDSQTQIRWTLGSMAFASTMMLIAFYNAYLSYDSYQLKQYRDRGETRAEMLATETGKDWESARVVSVPLLGIRVSVDDAAVLGTIVLFVLSLWLLLATRRENLTVGTLLRDTSKPNTNERAWLVFHAIVAHSLFAMLDPSLPIISSIDTAPQDRPARVAAWLSAKGLPLIRGFFFLFPVVTVVLAAGIDIWSYFVPDPLVTRALDGSLPYAYQYPQLRQAFWHALAIYFCCGLPLLLCCVRASLYSRATSKILQEYGDRIR
ncbi:MAG TPA: hypothetical protein VGR95_00945 [Thermoanaerobaculia bacterium]|jgi:hypothetical protein|nr:hypothetical protein [Thermoanaerobaculia bacterium]